MTLTKTPEQMAEEYATATEQEFSLEEEAGAYKGFLAGYQAAKDQLADVGKVMLEWISVKERLPIFRLYDQNNESGYTEDVLMRFVWGRIRISNFEKVDGVVSTSYGNGIDDVTHWMPLPSVEGLKHED